jgi:hypothetical protein
MAQQFHCRRFNGSRRAWFLSQEDAEAFALDPANSAYKGDIAHLCDKCGYWHLSRLEWLLREDGVRAN